MELVSCRPRIVQPTGPWGRRMLPASTAAATSATAGTTLLGFVDAQRAAAHVFAVEGADRRVSVLIVHLHEAEAARPTGFAVGHDPGLVHCAVIREQIAEL